MAASGTGYRQTAISDEVRLGLDVGGVISRMGCSADGAEIYKSVDPDFTSFALMFHQHWGLKNLTVISRTKKGNKQTYHGNRPIDHYSVRVCRAAGLMDLGMSDDQVHLCKFKSGIHGKRPIAAANVTWEFFLWIRL